MTRLIPCTGDAAIIRGLALLMACAPQGGVTSTSSAAGTTSASETSGSTATTEKLPTSGLTGADLGTGDGIDESSGTTSTGECTSGCNRLDILIVVDNSRGMGVKQERLVTALPHLVDRLRKLADSDGLPVDPDVNIMVTTTDVGHPICEAFQPPTYVPARGAPVGSSCTMRLDDFIGQGDDPDMPELCTAHCPADSVAVPLDSFVHFQGSIDNVDDSDGVGDPVADALRCIVPQGIAGCGFESPLEAMSLALALDQPWNIGSVPFRRPGAALAVVVLTDEADCSIEDFKYFDPAFKDHPEFGQYIPIDPDAMQKIAPTGATCWNGGMSCEDADANGVYESCVPADKMVLFPVAKYVELLAAQTEPVSMLLLAGVPPVTAHNPVPPFEPQAGGEMSLVYHRWTSDDLLPGDPDSAVQKEYETGIGPGCSDSDSGYGLPPARLLQVCRALDEGSRVRCCVESVCDKDLTPAIDCLAGVLSQQLKAAR